MWRGTRWFRTSSRTRWRACFDRDDSQVLNPIRFEREGVTRVS